MTDLRRQAAICLAALEVLPAEPADLTKILRDEASSTALFELSPQTGNELVAWLCDAIDYARVELWSKQLEVLERERGSTIALPGTPLYPAVLDRCWDAPPVLFIEGEVRALPTVAIVGSRTADPAALAAATALALAAATAGAVVVSGLAAGIDTAAHVAALEAHGSTIAVMGTGIRRVFPVENTPLAQRISQGGGANISQFTPNAPRTGTTFLRRNNVIAGLSETNVVVAGSERSGSRHQADQAIRYGRPVLLWEPSLHDSQWARAAVEQGQASWIETAADVLPYINGPQLRP